jgi:class 3 adenylate cyclase
VPPVRRLSAILVADVAGHSSLMGAEGTHERLNAHLGEPIGPKIAGHRGRIVKNTGDGFLAEFASALMLSAVSWRSRTGWPLASVKCPRNGGSGSASE